MGGRRGGGGRSAGCSCRLPHSSSARLPGVGRSPALSPVHWLCQQEGARHRQVCPAPSPGLGPISPENHVPATPNPHLLSLGRGEQPHGPRPGHPSTPALKQQASPPPPPPPPNPEQGGPRAGSPLLPQARAAPNALLQVMKRVRLQRLLPLQNLPCVVAPPGSGGASLQIWGASGGQWRAQWGTPCRWGDGPLRCLHATGSPAEGPAHTRKPRTGGLGARTPSGQNLENPIWEERAMHLPAASPAR